MTDIRQKISHQDWLSINKPARYMGGEVNQVPSKDNPKVRICIVFPDVYELGMSNLAVKIFYEILNKRPEIYAERAFAPFPDFSELLQRKDLPLFSLETGTPLKDFDALFITLPYEMTFTNILHILDVSKIPLQWKERQTGPLIISGGPSSSNPLPLSLFMDAVFIGEGEEAVIEMADLIAEMKEQNIQGSERRQALTKIEGLWVPEFPAPVKHRIYKGFVDSVPPLNPVLPNIQAVHDRATIEIFRGCTAGCRFCNAGFYYRPKRERKVEDVLAYSKALLENTGEDTLGLLSLSTSDYRHLEKLIKGLDDLKLYPEQSISIPSLRMSDNTVTLLNASKNIRKGGLTFAPEAGTQRLRDIINKNVTEEDIIQVITSASTSTYKKIKLYFMMGLPFETEEDLEGLVDLVNRLEETVRAMKPRKTISISLSGFVPKAFTPFQWARQATTEELIEKRKLVCDGLKRFNTPISWRDEITCLIEALFARGDEKISELLLVAYKNGCFMDGWYEFFSADNWLKSIEEMNINLNDYLGEKSINAPLPWDFVDYGTPKSFFLSEYQKAAKIAGVELQ
ncbi:MAG: radical SAM protein [Candidatus Riflebacteria bacterium]|nr:radical SAM protein [Candidatus Riflebacteria bacterium]